MTDFYIYEQKSRLAIPKSFIFWNIFSVYAVYIISCYSCKMLSFFSHHMKYQTDFLLVPDWSIIKAECNKQDRFQYIQSLDICFKLFHRKEKYHEALDDCKNSNGGNLMKIDRKLKQKEVENYLGKFVLFIWGEYSRAIGFSIMGGGGVMLYYKHLNKS